MDLTSSPIASKLSRRIHLIQSHLMPASDEAPAAQSPVLLLQRENTAASITAESSASPADYLHLDDVLTEDERRMRHVIRQFMLEHVKRPALMEQHAEKATFPLDLLPKLASVLPAGTFIKGYGCPAQSLMSVGLTVMEIAKVDASIATLYMVHGGISMAAIALCGSEEQKQKYLPAMARYESIGSFALTETNVGSDATHLEATAKRSPCGKGWILTGTKRWIGNASHAKVIVVWAKNVDTGKINGFIVENPTKGMAVRVIQGKIALRSVQNCDIELDNVFIPEENRLAKSHDFRSGPGQVLFISRLFAAWLPVGIAAGAYEAALDYCVNRRKQFGQPLAKFQLVQEKLVQMLAHLQSMTWSVWRVTKLMEEGKATHGMSSLVKANNSKLAREVVALARELLGGNGILREYGVATHFTDLEAIYTYEGTYDINVLVTGREITGINAIS